MLAEVFSFVCGKSPRMRRLFWKLWYNFLGGRFQNDDWTFMNYGYAPVDPAEETPQLSPQEEPDRRCIQLYDHLARAVPLSGKLVVEVGSGRGGGSAWVHRRHAPRATRGVDYSKDAVSLCRRRHRARKLTFVQGDAEHLPLPSAKVDVVLNVESSHCYGSREKFFREVSRVLKPGGHFLYTDFFTGEALGDVRRWLKRAGFEPVRELDITANVVRALELDHEAKRRKIRRMVPAFIAPSFEQFAGPKDSEVHTSFKTRTMTYHSWVLRKP